MLEICDVAIIGGGPCGLAMAARLREKTPSALFTDEEHQRYHWLNKRRIRKVATRGRATNLVLSSAPSDLRGPELHKYQRYASFDLTVFDSTAPTWMAKWTENFSRLEIKNLRSPLFFHPDPRDRDGLKAWAYSEGREVEMLALRGVVGKEISKHQAKKNARRRSGPADQRGVSIDERDMQDYFTPATTLFNDFCQHCARRYHLQEMVEMAEVESVRFVEDGRGQLPDKCFIMKTSSGIRLARSVVLASGPGLPMLPDDVPVDHEGLCHSSQLLPGHPLSPHVSAKIRQRITTNIVVVGGGLTSAQIADLLLLRGVTKVWHMIRGGFNVKHFDLDLEWVSKYRNLKMAAFWSADSDEERLDMIRSAKNGGSITPMYKRILARHEAAGRLSRHTKTTITKKVWDFTSKTWTLSTDPPIPDLPQIDYIYYATGTRASIESVPCLRPVFETYPVKTIGGLPCLTEDLQWSNDIPLFVIGRLAGLRLGPGAANLEGARLGAERIAWRLEEMFEDRRGKERDLDQVSPIGLRPEEPRRHRNMYEALNSENL